MLWLFLACVTGGSDKVPAIPCVTVYQAVRPFEVGADPSGYVYCAEEEGEGGAFQRVSSETCTGELVGECARDADCGAGELCVCAGGVPFDDGDGFVRLTYKSECVAATCSGPVDCLGQTCGLAFGICGDPSGHYCRGDGDACATDADCAGPERCSNEGSGWTCIERAECD